MRRITPALLILLLILFAVIRIVPEMYPVADKNSISLSATQQESSENKTAVVITEQSAEAAQPVSVQKVKSGKGAVVAFTFDDGYISDYRLVYPILKKYGIRGTSYIVAGFIDENRKTRLTWDEVKEMQSYGWDFGDHTFYHKDLATMSNAEIKKNMEAVNASFKQAGLKPPVVAAYPYGSYNQKVIKAMQPYRKQVRKAFYEQKFVNLRKVNPYKIDSISADMNSRGQLSRRKAIVDRACKEKAVVVFRAHSMFREKKNDTGKFLIQTDSRLFEQLVKYCVDKGCTFVTMEQLMKMYS